MRGGERFVVERGTDDSLFRAKNESRESFAFVNWRHEDFAEIRVWDARGAVP